ncbi:MAG: hypothetical protein GC171_13565 [Terrimonas sp.]|nr:hypothetical protein [Terrimonas sp.]
MSTIEKKSVKAGKFVNTEHVDAAIKNYKQERWVHNSKRLGKEDSLSVWYSVEELEDFLQKVRREGGDGVRMYFGAYDKEQAEVPLYAGRQTIVLVATKCKETPNGEVNKDLYIQSKSGNTILAYNTGRLCPPFCTTHDGGGFDEIGILLVDKGEDGMAII